MWKFMFGFSKFDCKFETDRVQKRDLENGNRGATVLSTDWRQTLGGECEHDSFSLRMHHGTFEPQCW